MRMRASALESVSKPSQGALHVKKQASSAPAHDVLAVQERPPKSSGQVFWRRWLRKATESRLGVISQYPPRALRIPKHYANVSPIATPAICIVTPSYNCGDFLERTIQSVLNQGYPHLEFIIQD